MKYCKLCILLLSFYVTSIFAFSQDLYPFDSPTDTKRFELLTKQIRCVVCQNQNLADSNAPLANDLREKVYHMVKSNKSNDEIKDYLTKRYGEFILLQPQFNFHNLLLWGFPVLTLIFTFLILFRRREFKV